MSGQLLIGCETPGSALPQQQLPKFQGERSGIPGRRDAQRIAAGSVFRSALLHILVGISRQFLLNVLKAQTERGEGVSVPKCSPLKKEVVVCVQDLAQWYLCHATAGTAAKWGCMPVTRGIGMSTLQRGVPCGCWVAHHHP